MSTKEIKMSVETLSTTALTKSSTVVAQNISCSYVKLMELNEYCNLAEEYLKECERKIESLKISKNESEKLRVELLYRNKANAINSDSLLQAKYELDKYRSDLKLEYVTTERAIKSRKLKCKKILSVYESEWEKTLEKYNTMPEVVELREIQKEVSDLETDIEKYKLLRQTTEQQFFELKTNIEKKFKDKIVEFAEFLMNYHSKMALKNEGATEETQKETIKSLFNFFHSKISLPAIKSTNTKSADEIYDETSVDVSMFDNLSIPSENFEVQNEDDFYLLTSTEEKQSDKTEDMMEIVSNGNEESNDEKLSENYLEEKDIEQNSSKIETESQYFALERQNKSGNIQATNKRKTSKIHMRTEEYFETIEGNPSTMRRENQEDGDQEIPKMMYKEKKGLGPENEESLSDGSYDIQENKNMEFNENFEFQYSGSFEETSPRSETNCSGNDKNGLLPQPQMDMENTNLQKNENVKQFGGFFTMENELNSPKPSIFKLF